MVHEHLERNVIRKYWCGTLCSPAHVVVSRRGVNFCEEEARLNKFLTIGSCSGYSGKLIKSLAFSAETWPGNSEGKTARLFFSFSLGDVISVTFWKKFSLFQPSYHVKLLS